MYNKHELNQIYFQRMPQIEHNAPKFMYRVYYKLDEPGKNWNIEDIPDWRKKELMIPDTDTYKRYRIKVVAHNQQGEANIAAQEVIGFSGEGEPSEAPKNFVLIEPVMGPRSALVRWNPVRADSINGEFKGYKIQTWTEEGGEEKYRESIMVPDSTQALVQRFKPYATNYARILAFNGAYNGPPSNIITIVTPEGQPGPIDMLDCYAMGSSALVLQWKPPQEPNGILTGYRIYYSRVMGTFIGPELEREPRISLNSTNKARLAGLEPNSEYRVTIKATTRKWQGLGYYRDCYTNPQAQTAPSMPNFRITYLRDKIDWYETQVSQLPRIKVTWQPNWDGSPGSHFYVMYRYAQINESTKYCSIEKIYLMNYYNILVGRNENVTQWIKTENQLNENFIVVRGLEPNHTYLFRVVAVDGQFQTPSRIQYFPPKNQINETSSGWFIWMILALIFLATVCVVVCVGVYLIKRNRGRMEGKFTMQELEMSHERGQESMVDNADG